METHLSREQYNLLSETDKVKYLFNILPVERTDANGIVLPMKCTPIKEAFPKNPKRPPKIKFPAIIQRKLNGFRGFNTDALGSRSMTSSSGKSYNVSCRYINAELERMGIPSNKILDGEVYVHGLTLNQINSLAQTEHEIEGQEKLEFHIFDLPSPRNAVERNSEVYDLVRIYGETKLIKFVQSYIVRNMEEVMRYHDLFVSEGYEGAIVRNFDGKYQYGIRSTEIFKVKEYQDAEFEIVDAVEGKRGVEDMSFIMKTKEGKIFNAKPEGKLWIKEGYWADLPNLVGRMGTVRFLNYSDNGIPEGNTVFLNPRKPE